MTNQYQQPSINSPRVVRRVEANVAITTDDEFITFDTSAAPIFAELPDARVVPGLSLFLKADNAGSTANPVTIFPDLGTGQTIDGLPSFQLTADQQAVIIQSDGLNFRVVGDNAAATSTGVNVEENSVLVLPNAVTLNFQGAGVSVAPGAPGTADITIPGGTGVVTGPDIPETNVAGTLGDFYIRAAAGIVTTWVFSNAIPGTTGWFAIGPAYAGAPVGAINGANQTYTFPSGHEAVFQSASPGVQIDFRYNGQEQVEGVDFNVIAGTIPGTTISAIQTTSFTPILGDVLSLRYIPA